MLPTWTHGLSTRLKSYFLCCPVDEQKRWFSKLHSAANKWNPSIGRRILVFLYLIFQKIQESYADNSYCQGNNPIHFTQFMSSCHAAVFFQGTEFWHQSSALLQVSTILESFDSCRCVCLPAKNMSLKTLPLLFINLGGEMMYILDQRLKAQNIPLEKARKGSQWALFDSIELDCRSRSVYIVYIYTINNSICCQGKGMESGS